MCQKRHLTKSLPHTLQEQALSKEGDAARARRQKKEAEATLEERVLLNAQQKDAARELKRQEVRSCRVSLQKLPRPNCSCVQRPACAWDYSEHNALRTAGRRLTEQHAVALFVSVLIENT